MKFMCMCWMLVLVVFLPCLVRVSALTSILTFTSPGTQRMLIRPDDLLEIHLDFPIAFADSTGLLKMSVPGWV